ncbi:MAG: hypothetical protein K0R31_396 [Clostridiales bacterium]|nr:hypothetical protein [Clostridiales bacterium]
MVPKKSAQYLSLVGNIFKNRDAEDFYDLAEYMVKVYCTEFKLKLVTRSKIKKEIKRMSTKPQPVLEIVNKSWISDEEISEIIRNSYATFLPHKTVTQSGNIPVSFREGTPVMARDLPGFRQDIDHCVNGYLLPSNFSAQDFYRGVLYIIENYTSMSLAARKKFDEKFSETNWEKYYSWLVGGSLE